MTAPVVERLAATRPVLAVDDVTAARERRIPATTIAALREAGAHRMLTPAEHGGDPVDLVTVVDAIEAVAVGSGAAAWNLATSCASASTLSMFDEAGVAEVFADGPDVTFAGSAIVGGRITPVEAGWRVDGHWPFGSGCLDARWLVAACADASAEPRMHMVVFARDDIAIEETWDTIGLAGTGSHDWRVNGVLVPERRVVVARARTRWPGASVEPPFAWLAAVHFSGVATGLARRAIDALVALASEKTPTGSRSLLRDRVGIDEAVGRASAQLESARAYRRQVIEECWAELRSGVDPTDAHGVMLRLAGTAAVEASVAVTERMFRCAGTSAIAVTSPIGAALRDVQVVAQGITVLPLNFNLAGRLLLGG